MRRRDHRVYLDTNVLIEAVEGRSELTEELTDVLLTFSGVPNRFVTSELTLAELLVKPMELGRSDLLSVYEELMRSDDLMETISIDRHVLRGAALLRSHDLSLKLTDAIHLASAIRGKCTHLLSNDRRLRHQTMETVRLTNDGLAALRRELVV